MIYFKNYFPPLHNLIFCFWFAAQLYLKLNRRLEAEDEYRKLLNRNPDNRQYYIGLEEARGLIDEESKLEFYAELRESYPRSMLARRIPLNYASGDKFRNLVDKYLRHALHKGAPPLFVDLRSLYTQPEKAKIIEELLLGYVAALTKCERFDETGSWNIHITIILITQSTF